MLHYKLNINVHKKNEIKTVPQKHSCVYKIQKKTRIHCNNADFMRTNMMADYLDKLSTDINYITYLEQEDTDDNLMSYLHLLIIIFLLCYMFISKPKA